MELAYEGDSDMGWKSNGNDNRKASEVRKHKGKALAADEVKQALSLA